MSQEKSFLGHSAVSTTYRFFWCFGAWQPRFGTGAVWRIHVPSRSFSHGDRPMLLIPPLVLGGPRADDLGLIHHGLWGCDKLTDFLTVVCRGTGHSEQ